MCEDAESFCILVVDDTPDNLEIIRETLHAYGYKTSGARTGGEALAFLDERCNRGDACPDLVILDIDLPDMKGGTLGMTIRETYPSLPFIYLTAYGRLPVFVDIANLQRAPLLTKPVEAEELVEEIERAVKDHKERRVVGKPIRERVVSFVREHLEEIERARGAQNGKA